MSSVPTIPGNNNRLAIAGIPKDLPESEIGEKGLFVIAKSKNGTGVEFYSIPDFERSRTNLLKYRMNTEGISTFTLKLFPKKDRIYISYLTRNQRLEIKSWSFQSQLMTDVVMPNTVQYLKPRLINAVGDAFLVSEEKYVTWPHESYKTTVCKFGLESEYYKCIEFNSDSLKEIICIGDDVFAFGNQKADVLSFNMSTGKRTSRGAINNNGVVKAVVFHDNLYIGSYVRSKCTLFVELFDRKNNRWVTVKYSKIDSHLNQLCLIGTIFLSDRIHLHLHRCFTLLHRRYRQLFVCILCKRKGTTIQ